MEFEKKFKDQADKIRYYNNYVDYLLHNSTRGDKLVVPQQHLRGILEVFRHYQAFMHKEFDIWQPMETALRDGRQFLVIQTVGNFDVELICWDEDEEYFTADGENEAVILKTDLWAPIPPFRGREMLWYPFGKNEKGGLD